MSMFHEGDLQSGISRAISEQKLVAVLIRQDDNHESEVWEDEWLASLEGGNTNMLGERLDEKAVLLRIDAGSKEAGFLGAFCPIDKAPSLIVIHNGRVLEKLEGGISQEEFTQRLLKAVGLDAQEAVQAKGEPDDSEDTALLGTSTPTAAATSRTHTMTSVDDAEELQDPLSPQTVIADPMREATLHPAPEIPEPPQPNSNVQTLLQERSQRLEAERLRREAQEKQERISRAKARREEAEAAARNSKPDKGKGRASDYNPLDAQEETRTKARADWIQQQAKRKTEAKQERERILLQIESDRQERRNKERMRKEMNIEAESLSDARAAAVGRRATGAGTGTCALQIRLFDGSSIKGRFAPDTTLATSVRTWISETSPAGGADIPYNFRQILAPNPSRSIEVTEESQTLIELGLLPTATLVLVPVAGYTEAYTRKGVLSASYLGSAYNLISWGIGLPFSALNYLRGGGSGVNSSDAGSSGLYMGGTADEQELSNVAGSRMANADTGTAEAGSAARGSGNLRMKTLADQRAEEARDKKTTFYNGNSLGFEPRKDNDGRSQPDG